MDTTTTERQELSLSIQLSLAIKFIFESYLRGRSITKLRDDLNEKYPKHVPWSYRSVRAILDNPVYCGFNQFKGEIYLGNHDPIITEESL